jgi:glyoxylase-like metal-dependent hydrolase (beta-lactamase superfamily II)
MDIKRIVCNPLQENCYIVSDDSRECVIIDCGAYYDEECTAIQRYITDRQLNPVHLLATHAHLDHNFGNAFLYKTYGLKPEICAEDSELLEDMPNQARSLFGMNISEDQPPIGRLLKNNDIITFGNHQLQVILTPGHSHGSALFYCQSENVAFSNQRSECGVAFSGDTLFRMSIGRTDFAEGSWQDMERSLRTIATLLPPDTLILPGHGPQTTLSDELAHNPYMRF